MEVRGRRGYCISTCMNAMAHPVAGIRTTMAIAHRLLGMLCLGAIKITRSSSAAPT